MWAGHSYVGDNTTNNVAEYNAAIIGIRAALRAGSITSLHCRWGQHAGGQTRYWSMGSAEPLHESIVDNTHVGACGIWRMPHLMGGPATNENWRADALANWSVDQRSSGEAGVVEWWGEAASNIVEAIPRPVGTRPNLIESVPSPLEQPLPVLPGNLANSFAAIDAVPLSACLLSHFVHLDDVQDLHAEAWAIAVADVLRGWSDAPDEAQRERMLKWLIALHDILLRLPPRGGRRGRAAVSHRFAAWAQGDFTSLIRWWQNDRAAARHPRHASEPAAAERTMQRALRLFSSGHIYREL